MAAPVALLDVNVLIALLDSQHVHHEPAYPQQPSLPQQPRWSGRSDAELQAELLLHHGPITDTYLLALAVHQRSCLGVTPRSALSGNS
jgi:hypothetical protein